MKGHHLLLPLRVVPPLAPHPDYPMHRAPAIPQCTSLLPRPVFLPVELWAVLAFFFSILFILLFLRGGLLSHFFVTKENFAEFTHTLFLSVREKITSDSEEKQKIVRFGQLIKNTRSNGKFLYCTSYRNVSSYKYREHDVYITVNMTLFFENKKGSVSVPSL